MKFNNFSQYVKDNSPKPNYFKNNLSAFLVGGCICTLGQWIQHMLLGYGISQHEVGTITSMILIFLGAFLTGIGVYDELGRRAGGGSMIPITGFANSIVSPAMEFKREGYLFGVGGKMFILAGPVLIYGLITSVLVGFVYYFYE